MKCFSVMKRHFHWKDNDFTFPIDSWQCWIVDFLSLFSKLKSCFKMSSSISCPTLKALILRHWLLWTVGQNCDTNFWIEENFDLSPNLIYLKEVWQTYSRTTKVDIDRVELSCVDVLSLKFIEKCCIDRCFQGRGFLLCVWHFCVTRISERLVWKVDYISLCSKWSKSKRELNHYYLSCKS